MTTVDADGIRYTDSISPTERTQEATDWSAWEAWIAGHLDQRCEAVYEAVGEVMAGLEQKIKTLELQLAQANGTLDILRGRGIPGTFSIKGTFDAKAVYNHLDVVAFNGASWVAKRDNPGVCPGDGWQLLAAHGSRGVRGERGPAGPAGITPTLSGASFSRRGMELQTSTGGSILLFKSVNVDPQSFTIKFIANDDSTLTISLLPLFESYHSQTK